ncbi:MAG: GIY-YIG nuclease family protein [Candidatus Kerfeldbacteria bacterium]|nr:GIY-YIG nuclease family protein [Candidatus Kerfeldbacteria bacterium]
MFYTYALKSLTDGHLYIGLTQDVEKRLKEHNTGKTRSTRNRLPFRLIYQESFNTRLEARQKEKYLKSGIGREFLKSLQT